MKIPDTPFVMDRTPDKPEANLYSNDMNTYRAMTTEQAERLAKMIGELSFL